MRVEFLEVETLEEAKKEGTASTKKGRDKCPEKIKNKEKTTRYGHSKINRCRWKARECGNRRK